MLKCTTNVGGEGSSPPAARSGEPKVRGAVTAPQGCGGVRGKAARGGSSRALWGLRAAVLWAALLAAACRGAAAGEPATAVADEQARRIFATTMSPYCPGQMLADCASSHAAALRDTIRARLRRGVEPEAVIDELVAIYGLQVLALPPRRGVGLVAWLGPFGALAVSLLLLLWWVRDRRRQTQPETEPATSGTDPAENARRARLRRELEEFD